MHWSLVPSTAWARLTPSSAAQPLPGARLLHCAYDVSRKYVQRVRWRDVAAEACHVPQAGARGVKQALRNDGIVALDGLVIAGIRHAHKRSEADALVRDRYSARVRIVGERVDVDEMLRTHHIEPHQIDQRRTAREILRRAGLRRAARWGRLRRREWFRRFDRKRGASIRPPSSTWRRKSPPRCWDRRRSGRCCRS